MNDHRFVALSSSITVPAGKGVRSARVVISDATGSADPSFRPDLEAAHDIQNHLLPSRLPRLEGLDYYGECRPAAGVGGDFFDFLRLPENCLAVSLGDVSGHGGGAAIMMSGLQTFLRGLTVHARGEISRTVGELNRAVYETSPDNFYATLFYAHVDALRKQVHYVSAGHEPALLVRGRTGRVQRLDSTGTVLGLTGRSAYERRTLSLEPRDVLVVYTDGVTEAADAEGREFGQKGILRVIQDCAHVPAAELVGRIIEEADRFDSYTGPVDDRTVIVIRFTDAATEMEPEKACIEVAATAA